MQTEKRTWHIPVIGDLRPWIGIIAAMITAWFGMKGELALILADQHNFVRIERVVKIETEISQLQSRDNISDGALLALKSDLSERMNRLETKIDEVLRWQRKN